MKRNRAHNVVIHFDKDCDFNSLCGRINAFHVAVIERRLNRLPLTVDQKLNIVDSIIENLRSREADGFIK